MSGLLEGWSAASSSSNDVAGGDVPRQPPGFTLAKAATDTIMEQRSEMYSKQWEANSAAEAQAWSEGSSYPPPPPTPNHSQDSDYANIPEQC